MEKKTKYLIIIVAILIVAIAGVFSLILMKTSTPPNNTTNQTDLNSTNNSTTTVTKEASNPASAEEKQETCPMCEGSGIVGQWADCTSCGGTSKIGNQTCPNCEYGRVFKPNSKKCEVCGGKGYFKAGSVKQI